MGRRPRVREYSEAQQRAREKVRLLQARELERRKLDEQTLRDTAQRYAKKYGKTLGGIAQRYIDQSEGSEFVVLNNKPSKHANKQQAAITDQPVKVYSPLSTKFSHKLNVYRDLQQAVHFDFRDDENLPTKHIALTGDELTMLKNMILADMNYTELLRLLEEMENK